MRRRGCDQCASVLTACTQFLSERGNKTAYLFVDAKSKVGVTTTLTNATLEAVGSWAVSTVGDSRVRNRGRADIALGARSRRGSRQQGCGSDAEYAREAKQGGGELHNARLVTGRKCKGRNLQEEGGVANGKRDAHCPLIRMWPFAPFSSLMRYECSRTAVKLTASMETMP